MRIDDELKILAVKTDMTITEMGRRMDKSPQAFSQKINPYAAHVWHHHK